MRVGRIDSSEQSVMNPPPADHVEKSIVDFSLIKHAKSLINSFINWWDIVGLKRRHASTQIIW